MVTVQQVVNGTARTVASAILQPGEVLGYTDGNGWYSLDAQARLREASGSAAGRSYAINVLKVGATMEAAGVLHSHHASTGTPGAWSPGTPGLSGRTTDGTASADAGCLGVRSPGSYTAYLSKIGLVSTIAASLMIADFLWVNTGIVVTTTTAQTINSVALPARDRDGATAGAGVMAGVLVTTATTNAGAVTTITMSYTNSAGSSGKTATISSFPATAVAGTLVLFQLAAGDDGVQSIQSVTLGTTLGGGAVSLVMLRLLGVGMVPTANLAADVAIPSGVQLFSGACLIPVQVPTAVTASNIMGVVTIEER